MASATFSVSALSHHLLTAVSSLWYGSTWISLWTIRYLPMSFTSAITPYLRSVPASASLSYSLVAFRSTVDAYRAFDAALVFSESCMLPLEGCGDFRHYWFSLSNPGAGLLCTSLVLVRRYAALAH